MDKSCQGTGGSVMPHAPMTVTGKPVQYAKSPSPQTSKESTKVGNKDNR